MNTKTRTCGVAVSERFIFVQKQHALNVEELECASAYGSAAAFTESMTVTALQVSYPLRFPSEPTLTTSLYCRASMSEDTIVVLSSEFIILGSSNSRIFRVSDSRLVPHELLMRMCSSGILAQLSSSHMEKQMVLNPSSRTKSRLLV